MRVRTPDELIKYVHSIRFNGRKLNSAGREQMLAACAFEGLKGSSSGYHRRVPETGPVSLEIKEGFPDVLASWLEAPHG
jgi:hypothetical protein